MNATQRRAFQAREREAIHAFNRGTASAIGIRATRAMVAESAAWMDPVDMAEVLRVRMYGSYAREVTR